MFRLEKFYPKDFNRQQYWDERYSQEHIAGKSSDEYKKQGFWPLLEEQLDTGKKYLDAGAGTGGWVLFLKEQGYDVEGIDTAARTIRAMSEYDPDLRLKVAGMTAIPYPDGFFGGVVSVGTLEYFEDEVPAALREVGRVLEPGGVLFLEVPYANLLRRLLYLPLKKLERAVKRASGGSPTFAHYLFGRGELRELLAEAGFEVATEQPHDLPPSDGHYGLYVDWKLLRGREPYQLNVLGKLVRTASNTVSPWAAATGIVVVAKKRFAKSLN